jgi:hypothetical protein
MSSIMDHVTKFAGEHPVATGIFLAGAAVSLLTHSCVKATESHSHWKKTEAHKIGAGKREGAMNAVLQGAALGFGRGLLTFWMWPAEATALAYVLLTEESPHDKQV